MSQTQPSFTPEQVTTAIRAAFSPRWDTSLTADEAENKARTYRSSGTHYRNHVHRSLAENDYLQVAEKSWGAFAQTVKAIGADCQIQLSSHVGIYRVAGELAKLVGETDPDAAVVLNTATAQVHSLHMHFYECDLPDEVVIQSAAAVSDAIDLLEAWFPPAPL